MNKNIVLSASVFFFLRKFIDELTPVDFLKYSKSPNGDQRKLYCFQKNLLKSNKILEDKYKKLILEMAHFVDVHNKKNTDIDKRSLDNILEEKKDLLSAFHYKKNSFIRDEDELFASFEDEMLTLNIDIEQYEIVKMFLTHLGVTRIQNWGISALLFETFDVPDVAKENENIPVEK